MIVKKAMDPSRDDAFRMTRNEKQAMIMLAHSATVLDDLQKDLSERLSKIQDGKDRMRKLAEESDRLLHEVRLTIPMEQRKSLENTCMDYEMRITPKHTPFMTNVIMEKEEFRSLVDFARTKCVDCTEDDESCAGCGLYRVLTSVLPLDEYHHQFLCPYNMGQWGN